MIIQQPTAQFTNVLNSTDSDVLASISDIDLNWNTQPLNPGNINVRSNFIYTPYTGGTTNATYSITINTAAQVVVEPIATSLVETSKQAAAAQANFFTGGGQWAYIIAAADTGHNEPGTAIFSNVLPVVVGSGTYFLDYCPGDVLYESDGTTALGTISFISNDTNLTLTGNSSSYNSTFRIRRLCIKWSAALNVYPNILKKIATISISCPTSSTVAQYVNSRSTPYVDPTNGIPLGLGELLVYDIQAAQLVIVQNYLYSANVLASSNTYFAWNPAWMIIAYVDSTSGRVRLGNGEYLKAYCKAYRNAGLTLTNHASTFYIMPFDGTAINDSFGAFTYNVSGPVSQYTIPYTGYYKFYARYVFTKTVDANSGKAVIQIRNGATALATNAIYYYTSTAMSSYNDNGVEVVTDAEYCTKGDLITVYYNISIAYALVVTNSSYCVLIVKGD